MKQFITRLLLVGGAVTGFGITAVDAVDDGGWTQLTAEAPEVLRPGAACPSNTNVWVNYADPLVFPCDPDSDNFVHIRYIPSTWTLTEAHNYCSGFGSDGAHTRYGATANVCPNIDF